MESILDNAVQKINELKKMIEELKNLQQKIRELASYYTSPQWKADYAADKAGQFPDKSKRGVLSEDGIWNMLERNRILLERIGTVSDSTKIATVTSSVSGIGNVSRRNSAGNTLLSSGQATKHN